ncbi:MAG TPA: mannonate dehydratase, partial [Bryobacteraceae bacterium]
MNRRSFHKAAGLALASAVRLPASAAEDGRMKLGTQHASDDATLRIIAALGVTHICSTLPSRVFDEKWSVDGLKRLRE